MIYRQVNIARIQTMADNSQRVVIDFDGSAEEFKELFELKSSETTLILCKTEQLPDVIQAVGQSLLTNNQ